MKRIEDIEKMSIEQLEVESQKSPVQMPEAAKERLANAIAIQREIESEQVEKRTRNKLYRKYWAMPIAAAVCAALLMVGYRYRTPEDTFTDPKQAYAEVEKVFALIGDKAATSMTMAQKNMEMLDKTTETLSKVKGLNFDKE